MIKFFQQQIAFTQHKIKGNAQRGFTLIELIVVILIILLLTGSLLNRVWYYQEQAEKAAMEQVAGAVQSALILKFAQLITNGREADVINLVSENPTHWLMRAPPNYEGEYFDMTPAAIAPGNWAYDLKSRELIYVPLRNDHFTAGKDGLKWVRYRVRLVTDTVSALNKRAGKKQEKMELQGVLLEPVEPYQWIIKEAQ